MGTRNSIGVVRSGAWAANPKNEGIDRAAWLKAVADVSDRTPDDQDPNVLTNKELAAQLSCTPRQAQRHVRSLLEAGKITETHKRVQRTGGAWVKVPAYRLVTTDAKQQLP